MKPDLLKYASQEVPRYTSYPTAPHFHAGVDRDCYANWLGELPATAPLSLYVHIPFCEKMCWYCGCHTNVVNGYDRVQQYIKDLFAEMDLVANAGAGKAGEVAHLHFGGGSPSLLHGSDFATIVRYLRERFNFAKSIEIAIEIDPRTMGQGKAQAYAKAGVTRASLGVQDFNLHVQQKINRIQPPELVKKQVDELRQNGINAINFDLIYGLPTQSLDDIRRTLDIAIPMQPDRFAVFGYAHVPWFKKHQEMIKSGDLPGVTARIKQADLVADLLVAAGYVRIGFDHFAKADDALGIAVKQRRVRRNFQGYTDDDCDILIGFGASSISALPQGYVQNNPQMGHWRKSVQAGELPVARGLMLDDHDKFLRAAIMQVLSRGDLDANAHCQKWNQPANALDDALAQLAPLAADGLIKITGKTLQILPEGIRFSRNIAACFDSHWKPKARRHSLAV
ncbi:Coproporphyrinogen III oxidase, oxygen-independent [hydrothermal vent metagenome]|uniref:coproporphyrinogen dehydrogenase n=1 Tax=hydrothermal vent metagenome TaxID=652676 RepID=A0A3B0RS35_9ZZZZ